MEEYVVEEIVKERITNNLKIFNEKELQVIKNNVNIVMKIYLLGIIDTKISVSNAVSEEIIKMMET